MKEYVIPTDVLGNEITEPTCDEAYKEKVKKVVEAFFADGNQCAHVSSVVVSHSVITVLAKIASSAFSVTEYFKGREELDSKLGNCGVRPVINYREKTLHIEIPNKTRSFVELNEILRAVSDENGKLTAVLGKDTLNGYITCDLSRYHGILVTGCAGSGKSTFLNSIVASLIYRYSPQELRLLLIAPENNSAYTGLPHLLNGAPITDVSEAEETLKQTVEEMNRRYGLFAEKKVRNIEEYNNQADERERLPKIVIVADDFEQILCCAGKKTAQNQMLTLIQKARAVGIYWIMAAQSASLKKLPELIVKYAPVRVVLKTADARESTIVLDNPSAAELFLSGDCFLSYCDNLGLLRIQTPYLSAEHTADLVDYIKKNVSLDGDSLE